MEICVPLATVRSKWVMWSNLGDHIGRSMEDRWEGARVTDRRSLRNDGRVSNKFPEELYLDITGIPEYSRASWEEALP